jgi:hypothetical protein
LLEEEEHGTPQGKTTTTIWIKLAHATMAFVTSPRPATAPHHEVRGERRGRRGTTRLRRRTDGGVEPRGREGGEEAAMWGGGREEGPTVRRGEGEVLKYTG